MAWGRNQALDRTLQEDAWTVITSFFEEKGLVRQQLDSFNEFIDNTMQEVIDENPGKRGLRRRGDSMQGG